MKQQGPVKLKKTQHVMGMFIGNLNIADKEEYIGALKVLGNPRDILRNHETTSKMRRNFIFVYDSMPLDPGRKICGLQSVVCEELPDFCGESGQPVVGTFRPSFLCT